MSATNNIPAVSAEVVVYGASPAGIAAAISAAEQGQTTLLIATTPYVGGMMAPGGLCNSDFGDKTTESVSIQGFRLHGGSSTPSPRPLPGWVCRRSWQYPVLIGMIPAWKTW